MIRSALPGLLLVLLAAPWQQKADMLRKRGEHANAVVNGKIYVLGGIYNSTTGPSQVEVYDPAADRWSDVSTLPVVRHHFTAGSSVYGTEIWVCGGKTGGDTTGTRRVDVYNAATNRWRRAPDLPEVHWGGPAVVNNGKLHVLTGAQGNMTTTAHHFVLDLRNEAAGWKTARAVPRPRVHVAGVSLGGKVWLLGGEHHHAHDGDTNTVQVYDPSTNTWDLTRAPLPRPRSHAEWATFVHDGRIWSVGGVDSSKTPRGQENIYRYDPAANAWTELDPLPGKLVSPGAKIVNGVLYVFGGGVDNWFSGSMRTTWARPVSTSPTPPLPPSALTALAVSSSRIDLSWADNSPDETGFEIERAGSSTGPWSRIATVGAGSTSRSDTGLPASTTRHYRVRAVNGAGASAYSNVASATTLAGSAALPPPWQTQDVGAVAAAGDASYADGTFTVSGSGADIYGTADEFRFVHQPLSGDGTVTARVTGQTHPHDWAKAGVMIRESLAANARHVSMTVTPVNGTEMNWRAAAGGSTSKTNVPGAAPTWVRLRRQGNAFTASLSTDGLSWTAVNTVTVSMGSHALAGLAVTSHKDGAIGTATFDAVAVSPAGSSAPLVASADEDLPELAAVPASSTDDGGGSPNCGTTGAELPLLLLAAALFRRRFRACRGS